MKATKLIINGEEQNLSQVYSVNGESGDVQVKAIAIVDSTAPATPVEGQLWYDTANSVLKLYHNNQWVTI